VRRPLFTGLLATLLAVTGQNLQVTLALLVAVNAIAGWLLAREIQASHGPLAAVLGLLLLFLFYRVEGGLGTTLTENLGLPLGMLSMAGLWRGARTRRMGQVWLGIGLLTLALMARAGAFFVLPALLVGGAWSSRRQGCSARRFVLGAAVAIALGGGLSLALGKILANPATEQTAFSNFSQTLYGLVVGSKGWGQVLTDYPQAHEGVEIYALAWQAFRAHPLGLLTGSLKMWREYFPPYDDHAFAFVGFDAYATSLQLVCYGSSAVGLVQCLRRSQQPPYGFVGAATLGHLASIPFAPPIDAGLRVYAATMPLLVLLVAIAVGELLKTVWQSMGLTRGVSLPTTPDAAGSPDAYWLGAALVCGLGLAALALLGPLVLHWVSHAPHLAESPCPAGQETIYVRLSPGAVLRVVDDQPPRAGRRVMVPDIRVTDLRKTAGAVEIKHDVDRFVAGTTMMNTYDLKSGRYVWLVAPTSLVPEPWGIVRMCGYDSADAKAKNYGVFYTVSVHKVAQPGRV
jgi:hypothetical protein